MFSYRHAFHAGNHADVLKHIVLMQVLNYFAKKEAPYTYVDTHAGAGLYALDGVYAQKSQESLTGVAPLWKAPNLPSMLADYVQFIRKMNLSGGLRYYPGSPYIADQLARDQDRLRLFELHSTESKVLLDNFKKMGEQKEQQDKAIRGKRVMIAFEDGFKGLISLLPPPSRRAVVLIDPSYEDKLDYRKTVWSLEQALLRFKTGTYIVWYPIIGRLDAQKLPTKLKKLCDKGWLHATLNVGESQREDGLGLCASGVFVFNPPWTLEADLKANLPVLVKLLGRDKTANYTLESKLG